MDASGTGIGRLDCYEDMFKEITRKLYGDDPDHRTSNVQNEFEASVTFKAEGPFKVDHEVEDEVDDDHDEDEHDDEDDCGGCESAVEASDDAVSWILDEEPLKGTDGSRIAAYRAATSTWRCYECGDCMGGGTREVGEHFMSLHAPQRLDDGSGSRNRTQQERKECPTTSDLKLEDVLSYLEKVRERAERLAGSAPSRRTQHTQTLPAVLLPLSPTFLLQELPSSPPQQLLQPQPQPQPQQQQQQQQQQHHHQQASSVTSAPTTRSTTATSNVAANNASGKRYTCLYCPYGTDRRDLYTRHENIHREEKPFHCYVCCKPFSRADHVKKHFLRMHREHTYELSRIRRPVGSSSATKPLQQPAASIPPPAPAIQSVYQQQLSCSSGSRQDNANVYQASSATSLSDVGIVQPVSEPSPTVLQASQPRRLHNPTGKTQPKSTNASTKNQERRYTCCYCSWSGVDNWCLKRHLNTHLKPFACALCEYKAARAERLATHVLKVHNRRQCSRCSFLAEDLAQLQVHQLHVHRTSNSGSSATAAAAASSATTLTAQQPTPTTTAQQQDQNNEQHQIQSLNGIAGGRAPPGPPVFPASSAAIAPTTTVIPPTSILGDRASMPSNGCWEQEASSCEARFQRASTGSAESRRSRKQSTPRKVTTCLDVPEECTPLEASPPKEVATKARLLKCYHCPKSSSARAKAYHSKASLLLHKIWRHRAIPNGSNGLRPAIPALIPIIAKGQPTGGRRTHQR